MLINIYRFDLNWEGTQGLTPVFVKQFNYHSQAKNGITPSIMLTDNTEQVTLKKYACLIGQKFYRKFNPKVIILETEEGEINLVRCNKIHTDKISEEWGSTSVTGATKESRLIREIKDTQYYLVLQSFAGGVAPIFSGGIYQGASKNLSGWFTKDHSEETA